MAAIEMHAARAGRWGISLNLPDACGSPSGLCIKTGYAQSLGRTEPPDLGVGEAARLP
jgi:hypothetical protein